MIKTAEEKIKGWDPGPNHGLASQALLCEIREREPATSFRHKRQGLLFPPLGFSSCRGAEGALKPLDHRRESGFHSPHVTRTPVGMFQKMVFFCTRTLQEM
ncbi:hypothetical protein NPIL_263711 [Nephila pilipes]|uniref:Uncharacterized protein n=1 Tax=Nephila pilipes TaxID=299642 RepID=A0A8X6UJZ6_NEPPI|nr:hypothetical protein NPIL_263711 [Nephila pilipes]